MQQTQPKLASSLTKYRRAGRKVLRVACAKKSRIVERIANPHAPADDFWNFGTVFDERAESQSLQVATQFGLAKKQIAGFEQRAVQKSPLGRGTFAAMGCQS